jgi:hypothetical protein
MNIEPFTPAHFARIELQPQQAYLRAHLTAERCAWLASKGAAFAALVDDRVIACGGVVEWDASRGMVWAHLSRDLLAHMVPVHRAAARLISTYRGMRLQATCAHGFGAGARWLSMLGFVFVRELPEYGPAHTPHDFYLRCT